MCKYQISLPCGFRKTLVVVTLKTRTAFLKPEKTCHAAAIPGPNGLLRCLGSRSGPDKQGGQGDLPGNRFRPIRFPLTPECLPPAAAHCRGSGRLSATCRWSSLGTHQSRCGTCRASTLWFGFRPCLWLSRRLAPCHADATQPCTHILRVSLTCAPVLYRISTWTPSELDCSFNLRDHPFEGYGSRF